MESDDESKEGSQDFHWPPQALISPYKNQS
jgi:hypothetical protein